ncbi:MAG: alpha/beta hydrolase [Candidatus Saccharibacteria bacterium]
MKIKRVIIIHGWADKPHHGWLGWLDKELSKIGVEVIAPAMPNPKLPNLKTWEATAAKAVGKLDQHTALVGHSLGTFTLLRVLEHYNGSEQAAKLILVAGFLTNGGRSLSRYFSPEPNTDQVKTHVKQVYHIFSDNDVMVKPARSKKLAKQLGGQTFEIKNQGHFITHKGTDFPLILDIIQNY